MHTEYYTYMADKHDTIESIAGRLCCDAKILSDMNPGIRKDHIEGTLLKIPANKNACSAGAFYKIKSTDTLCRIANHHGISTAALLYANPFFNPLFCESGQVIIIPYKNRGYDDEHIIKHKLTRGECLHEILQRYNLSIAEFKKLNNDTDIYSLHEGQHVNVREPEINPHKNTAVILDGETIEMFSRRIGCSVIDLLKLNTNLRPKDFTPGKKVVVPK